MVNYANEKNEKHLLLKALDVPMRYSAVCSNLRNMISPISPQRIKAALADMLCGAAILGAWQYFSGSPFPLEWRDFVDTAKHEGDWLAEKLDGLIHWLQTLVEWLMGNPAGLKLNKPLNQTLGHFFLYHIYLWRTYVTFVRPVCEWILLLARFTLPLGLSFLGSLVLDLSSLLTLHIYCFHIYATRLYQLQVSALISLWRLFRGKKRNPLRDRVDSAEFDSQQLFLGTLLFTVLLFLLPTVLLYYSVFSTLRFAVYASQRVIGSVSNLPHRLFGRPMTKDCENRQKTYFMQPDLSVSSLVTTTQNVLLGNVI